MPKYRITGPDGGTYEVNAPEGATEADVMAYAQANYKPKDAAPPIVDLPAVQAERQNPTDGMGTGEKMLAGIGKSFVDAGRGMKQAGTDAARYFVEEGLGQEAPGLRASLAKQQGVIDEARQLDAPLMDTKAGLAGNVIGYGAQILGPGAAFRGTAIARAALPKTVAGNIAQGTVLSGLQPVATGQDRATQAGLGTIFSAGGSGLAKVTGAAATRARNAITPAAREAFDTAKKMGITLTPSQLSDSRFMRFAQSMLRSVPFTGAQGRHEAQVGLFNRELAKTIGEDAPQITSEVYSMAKKRQSNLFNELTERNALKVDDKLLRSLTNIAESSKVSPTIAAEVEAAIESLYSRATTSGNGVVIPGAAYQAFDSELGQIVKAGGSQGHFIGNVQKAVRRAMDDSISPEDAAAWKALRTEYGNRKTLTNLVAGASDGPISPAAVMGAVKSNGSAKEAMASGTRGQLGELAKIGQRMKEPPSSGTAERSVVAGLMGGGAMIDPVTGGLTIASLNLLSRGMDSRVLAGLMMRQNPGMTRQAAAALIQRATNPAGQGLQNRRPLELDITGGTPIPMAEAQRQFGP